MRSHALPRSAASARRVFRTPSSKVSSAPTRRQQSNVKGAWVKDQEVTIENGKVTGYKVILKVTFILQDGVD